ncbi:MAG TPA: hypothetical protein VF529_07505 [Solirubrobacteraceae bacterium]
MGEIQRDSGDEMSREALAAISGGSAVVGALAGGGVAGWSSLRGQRRRQEFDREERVALHAREDEHRARQIRGVAREIRREFKRNLAIYERHIGLGFWWSEELPRPRLFDREVDRALIASAMTEEQWRALEDAEAAFSDVEAARDLAVRFAREFIAEKREGGEELDTEISPLSFELYPQVFPEFADQGVEGVHQIIRRAITPAKAAVRALNPLCA